MTSENTNQKPSCLAPEILQSSSMDCGPAALQAVLAGYGISSDYDELRSRCQTDVDGTSVYELSRLGREMGLSSAQVLVPRDTLLRRSARCTPAIAVISEGAGLMHFIVLWNTFGPWVQVMDPGTGRRWERKERLLARLPDVPVQITEERFRRWRKTVFARHPLIERLLELGLGQSRARELVEQACSAESWRPYARLDAATRMVSTLRGGSAIGRRGAPGLLEIALERATSDGIPISFWWIWESDTAGMLTARGAPIVRFEGAAPESTGVARSSESAPKTSKLAPRTRQPAKPNLESSVRFLSMLTIDRNRDLLLLVASVLLAALVAVLDLVLLQALLHTIQRFFLPYYRAGAVLSLVALSFGGLVLDWTVIRVGRNLGRRLEVRMRKALFETLPLLSEEYLRTRPTSDMAERGHSIHLLRRVPETARRICEALVTLTASAVGIAWVFPESRFLAATAALAMLVLPWLLGRSATELLARSRTHGINLERFYLDSLLGVIPIRVHAADKSVRREHESLLVEWLRSMLSLQTQETLIQGYQTLAGAILSIVFVVWYFQITTSPLGALLVFYWSTRFPTAGSQYVNNLVVYRSLRLAALRFFSPLFSRAVDRDSRSEAGLTLVRPEVAKETLPGVALRFHEVEVKAANRVVLSAINLEVPSGQHVAIVGPSGAGKSSLVGLLLGWLKPLKGDVSVDGVALDARTLLTLRSQTAWLDPTIQIWNDTLIQNLLYGTESGTLEQLRTRLPLGELTEVLENLPEGLQAILGEGGTRLSGGQGQRVRLTRMLMRQRARLVILDEPFRGLERPRRQLLLERVRACFKDATLLFVSHDIRDTESFERVLVVEGGRIVEDGSPAFLKSEGASRYRALLEGDRDAHANIWGEAAWRRVKMQDGRLIEAA